MKTEKRIRVLIAKPGLDGHDRGAKIIATALRDAGIEVIYGGLHMNPEEIAIAALQEDVDLIGISILSGAHKSVCRKVMAELRERKMDDVKVVVGGIVPACDVEFLRQIGVSAVFVPGTPLSQITEFVKRSCAEPMRSSIEQVVVEGNCDA
jgi:methylmalonyl-CoA mutase, C-terminal domain